MHIYRLNLSPTSLEQCYLLCSFHKLFVSAFIMLGIESFVFVNNGISCVAIKSIKILVHNLSSVGKVHQLFVLSLHLLRLICERKEWLTRPSKLHAWSEHRKRGTSTLMHLSVVNVIYVLLNILHITNSRTTPHRKKIE